MCIYIWITGVEKPGLNVYPKFWGGGPLNGGRAHSFCFITLLLFLENFLRGVLSYSLTPLCEFLIKLHDSGTYEEKL
jgi:hypothetical protein